MKLIAIHVGEHRHILNVEGPFVEASQGSSTANNPAAHISFTLTNFHRCWHTEGPINRFQAGNVTEEEYVEKTHNALTSDKPDFSVRDCSGNTKMVTWKAEVAGGGENTIGQAQLRPSGKATKFIHQALRSLSMEAQAMTEHLTTAREMQSELQQKRAETLDELQRIINEKNEKEQTQYAKAAALLDAKTRKIEELHDQKINGENNLGIPKFKIVPPTPLSPKRKLSKVVPRRAVTNYYESSSDEGNTDDEEAATRKLNSPSLQALQIDITQMLEELPNRKLDSYSIPKMPRMPRRESKHPKRMKRTSGSESDVSTPAKKGGDGSLYRRSSLASVSSLGSNGSSSKKRTKMSKSPDASDLLDEF